MKAIQLLRNMAQLEEIDYVFISSCLQGYSKPRNIITWLIRSGDIIRVKKGIYVFGPNYARRPYCLEILANQIYGPSYVSCEYALSYYGFILERVYEVTCLTNKRNKIYTTPVGRFSYRYLHPSKFPVGITQIAISSEYKALIACPEKALADLLYTRNEAAESRQELKQILFEDYRIDPNKIKNLNIKSMIETAKIYNNLTISLLPNLIREARQDA